MRPYRTILADDHPLFREGLKRILENYPKVELLGEAEDGLELLELMEKSVPDLVILDISMPHYTGVEALKKIKSTHPEVKVLILTMHKSIELLQMVISAGGNGYILKNNAYEDLFAAIDAISQGGFYISNLMSHDIISLFRHTNQRSQPNYLSHREQEVLALISEGKSGKEIAERLAISIPTAQNYRYIIKKKLNIRTNAELIKYALHKGYI